MCIRILLNKFCQILFSFEVVYILRIFSCNGLNFSWLTMIIILSDIDVRNPLRQTGEIACGLLLVGISLHERYTLSLQEI